MSLPDLAAVLWRQRELLERLSYRLECEQLLLAAGRARWLSQATSEVESLLAELQVVELQRAAAAQAAATELGMTGTASLEELAAGAQPPWSGVLLEHRNVLITLTVGLSALAETNRHLMDVGMQAVETALAHVGLSGGPNPSGYDSRGRRAEPGSNRRAVIDRAL